MAELRDSSVSNILDVATSFVKAVAEALAAFIVALIQELDFFLFRTSMEQINNVLLLSFLPVSFA